MATQNNSFMTAKSNNSTGSFGSAQNNNSTGSFESAQSNKTPQASPTPPVSPNNESPRVSPNNKNRSSNNNNYSNSPSVINTSLFSKLKGSKEEINAQKKEIMREALTNLTPKEAMALTQRTSVRNRRRNN